MTAEDLRKSILQQAIQGKLVPQDPKDEPASELLARIREEKERLVKDKKIKRDKNESIIYRGEDNSYYEKFLATGEVKCIDEEIPFEIPQNWVWARIGHLYQHNTGKALNASNTRGSLKKYLTTSNVYWGNFDFSVVKEMPFTDEEIDKCTVSKGDLLVCEGGDIGRAAVWTYDYNICIQNHIHRLRAYCEICTRYIYNIFWLYKRNGNIGGKGIGIQGLSANALHNILIPVPPFAEQYRIVEKMDMMEPLLEDYGKHKEQVSLLDNNIRSLLCKSVLQYAIQGQLVQQNETDEPVSILLDRIRKEKKKLQVEGKIKKKEAFDSVIFKGEDNKYYEKTGDHEMCIDEELPFDIPETWTWIRFKNLVEFSLGKTPERSNSEYWKPADIPWVSIADMNDKSILLSTKEHISAKALNEKFGAKLSPKGTLIMSFKLTIGKVSILGIDTVHNEAIISIYPYLNEENIVRDFLYNFLCIITGYTSSTDAIKGATLNSKTMGEMLIPLPPLNEQKRIIRALDNALASIMSR